MPKRYTFFGEQTICNLADDVYNHVRYANAVFPICKADVEARRIAFNKATGSLHALAGHIDIMAEVLSGNPECESWLHKAMERWRQLIDEELKMINPVRKKDKERFKKFIKEEY